MQGLILSTVVLLAVLPVYLEAGRRQKQCSDWTFGDCMPVKGECGRGKKGGTRSGENCKVTEKEFKCRVPCAKRNDRCKYEKPEGAEWSACDVTTNKMSIEGTLKGGSSASCPASKTIMRPCRSRSKAGKAKQRCKYEKTKNSQWSACDPNTNKTSVEGTLKEGSPSECAGTKTMFRRCRPRSYRDGCKYIRAGAKWSECDQTTGESTMILKLSNRSDPQKCSSVKERTKKCRNRTRCAYTKGEWSECDAVTGMKTRMDILNENSGSSCEATRPKTKNCGKGSCQYQFSEWSEECKDGHRSRTKALVKGDAATCEKEKVQTRACATKNGKERCFFGPWGDFGSCQNGVRTRTRSVISGGSSCEKKAVKTKMCKDRVGEARIRKQENKQKKKEEKQKRREEKRKEKVERRNRRKTKKNRGSL